MSEAHIDAQMDRETAIAGLENAARRYAAAFLAIAAGEANQEQLWGARQRGTLTSPEGAGLGAGRWRLIHPAATPVRRLGPSGPWGPRRGTVAGRSAPWYSQ